MRLWLRHYLTGRFQRVDLNGQTSSWRPFLAGVPQGSILGPLLLLVYINDLPNGLIPNAKLFADDTSLFTIVKDKNESANILNNDLSLIFRRAYDWKMLFNPDPKKLAQEVLFWKKKISKSSNYKPQRHPCRKSNLLKTPRNNTRWKT